MSDSPGLPRGQRGKAPYTPMLERRRAQLNALAAVEKQIRLLTGWVASRPSLVYATRTRVDYAALPPALAHKVSVRATHKEAARAAAVGGPDVPYGRMDPTRLTPTSVWWTVGGLVGVAPFLILIALGELEAPIESLCLMPAPWGIALALSVGIHRWQAQGPLTLTRAEAALVRKHTTTVQFDVSPGGAWEDHHAIQGVAATILAGIESSPAWQSPHCDLDRIQLDLAEEMFQIQQSCQNLAKLHNVIAEAKPTNGATSVARVTLQDKVAEYETLYREARAAVIRRLAALYTYRQRLTEIEVLLDDLAKTTELAARTDDFTEAFTAIVRDTAAAERTEALSADLEILRAQLEAELTFISGSVIHDPELVMPLTVRPEC
jgi:hypothetical protein